MLRSNGCVNLLCVESIAAPMDRRDALRVFRIVADRLAEIEDARLQYTLLHEGVRPASVQQLFFLYNSAGMLDKIVQYREGLGCQLNPLVFPQDALIGGIQVKG